MKTLKVTNHLQFACFDYQSVKCASHKLGDVVIRHPQENDEPDDKPEIGVIIQIHGAGDYRTDMFGNCDLSELKTATLKQIREFRPDIEKELKKT